MQFHILIVGEAKCKEEAIIKELTGRNLQPIQYTETHSKFKLVSNEGKQFNIFVDTSIPNDARSRQLWNVFSSEVKINQVQY